jgi:D-sedoheptulose 7-phosphate isomerase
VNSIRNCESYFAQLAKTIESLPFGDMDRLTDVLLTAYEQRRTVFIFGNGGSAALASHFACDLGKGTARGSCRRFRVMALTDNVPLVTAWANDANYGDIFAEQLANFAGPGDVALAISASGNSPNVLRALRGAKQAGSVTAGLTGFSGGRMLALCDACVVVRSENMQIIEDVHVSVAHSIFTCIRARIDQHPPLYRSWGPRLVARTAAK